MERVGLFEGEAVAAGARPMAACDANAMTDGAQTKHAPALPPAPTIHLTATAATATAPPAP